MDYLLRRLVRTGFRRGVAGNWAWLALALAALVLRRARRSRDDVVSLPVRRGERYVVSLSDPGAADGPDA